MGYETRLKYLKHLKTSGMDIRMGGRVARVGDAVTIMESFTSRDTSKTSLPVGGTGIIRKIQPFGPFKGNAYIAFEDQKKPAYWVDKKEFTKMKLTKLSPEEEMERLTQEVEYLKSQLGMARAYTREQVNGKTACQYMTPQMIKSKLWKVWDNNGPR